ncbi:biliverdin-producing heme oxygenase [soil metagenome]
MTITDTEAAPAFSATLRDRTAGDHQHAERSPFIGALMAGTLPRDGYVDMLAQHWYAYAAIEGAATSWADDPVVSPFLHPGLERLPALTADLNDLAGIGWAEAFGATEATVRYVARLLEVGATWPGGYVAHHYTRYLGDLSGGQHIGRVAARTYGLTPEHGGRFSRFEGVDATAVKSGYRTALDAAPWDAEEQERVIAEIREAYRFNTEVFADLDHHVA